MTEETGPRQPMLDSTDSNHVLTDKTTRTNEWLLGVLQAKLD